LGIVGLESFPGLVRERIRVLQQLKKEIPMLLTYSPLLGAGQEVS